MLSEDNQGCGIIGEMALDLIMNTPASQTEVVAHLVEISSKLRYFALPELTIEELEEGDGHNRKLLQEEGELGGSILNVDDDLDTNTTTSVQRSEITGTADFEDDAASQEFGANQEEDGDDHQHSEDEKRSNQRNNNRSNNSGPAAAPAAEEEEDAQGSLQSPQKEDEDEPLAGSLSFEVSEFLDGDETPSNQNGEMTEDSWEAVIQRPLTLNEPIDHLLQVNTSTPVLLKDIIAALEPLTAVLEKGPEEKTVEDDFFQAAGVLEVMRFRLDSRSLLNASEITWNVSDAIWLDLQEMAQSLDIAYSLNEGVDETVARGSVRLLSALRTARDVWNPRQRSGNARSLASLETRLEAVKSQREFDVSESPSGRTVSVGSLDRLVSVVVDAFNRTLHEIYPDKLRPGFAEKYNQTWVQVHVARSQKWCAIMKITARESYLGSLIVALLRGLYSAHSPMASASMVPYLRDLNVTVDDLVGVTVATHSDRYRISNLPRALRNKSLRVWQMGPQITAATLNAARIAAVRDLEDSVYVDLETFVPASDKVTRLLEALISMIDAKASRDANGESLPEETAIVLTMEAALNLITAWNNFALANDLENSVSDDPFGHPSITDFTLSLVGCLTLGSNADGHCHNMDRSGCQIRGLREWDKTTGMYSLSSYHTFCAPEQNAGSLVHLFDDVPSSVISMLVEQITDLYFISAYCPFLAPDACRSDERCDLFVIEDHLGCRPSSNFINYVVENGQIAGLAATSDTCEAYLELPVCGNFKSSHACTSASTCLWTEEHQSLSNETRDMCMIDWVEQMRTTNPKTLQRNGLLTYSLQQCREQTTARSCSQENFEDQELLSHESQLPSSGSKSPWPTYLISLSAGVGFAMLVYVIWRKLYKKPAPVATPVHMKKGKGKKKGDLTPRPAKIVQLPMFQHIFEVDSSTGTPNQKRDDFDFVKEAIETDFASASSSRVASSYGDRMERHTSGTTAEISEIQPISEDEEVESSSDSDEIDSHVGWTTSSEEWYDEEDGFSLPDQPT